MADLKPDCMSALVNKGLSALDSVAGSLRLQTLCLLPSFQAVTSVVRDLCKSKARTGSRECSTLTIEQKITAYNQQGCRNGPPNAPISATPSMLAEGMASIHVAGSGL